jgi:hypothetical protein
MGHDDSSRVDEHDLDDSAEVAQITIRVPIGGMFPSVFHFAPGMGPEFERTIGPGATWRRTTEADRELLAAWFDFYKDFHSAEDARRGEYEPTVLATDEPIREDEEHMNDWGYLITSLVLAATLCTKHIGLRYQSMHFAVDSDRQRPKAGTRRFETLRLASWGGPAAEEITPTLADAIVRLVPFVGRALRQPIDHRVARAVVAYRVATSSAHFADHIPVLLCASLEALTGSSKEGLVLRRVEGFVQSTDAHDKLKRLYLNRQWFAHGADVPAMREVTARDRALDDGLTIVKEVIRNALLDDEFFDAAFGKPRDVAKFLEERSAGWEARGRPDR